MSAASTFSRRILSLALPRLPTDRLIRAERGRSWRSNGRPDAASAAARPDQAASGERLDAAAPGDGHPDEAASAAPPEAAAPTASRPAGRSDPGSATLVATADAVAAGATRLARRIGQGTWMPPAGPGESRQARLPPGPPIAVVARDGGALRLAAVDAVAEARGLCAGLGLADARAMVPDLMVAEADPPGDRALLAAIADWCDRYTPLVALDTASPAGLLLDIAGAAHLFGGEAALAADLVARLTLQGFAAAVGIADTPGAAWAAAHFVDHPGWTAPHLHTDAVRPRGPALKPDRRGFLPVRILEPGSERAALAALPLAALRLDAAVVAGLDRVGLKTIGAILDMPRAPLARRFGPRLAERLDQALGRADEPISPRRPVPALAAERRFPEPILTESDVLAVVRALAGHLAGPLEARGEGARVIELALFRVDGAVARLVVGSSRPLRDPARIAALFAEKIARLADGLDIGFGFETLRLAVPEAERDSPAQIDLTGEADAAADLDHLVDRLGARLGTGRVARALPQETHVPEAAARLVPVGAAAGGAATWAEEPRGGPDDAVERPVRLFARPEPIEAVAEVPEGPPIRFRWRRATYDIARYEGPERIAAEWWRTVLPASPGEAEEGASVPSLEAAPSVRPEGAPGAGTGGPSGQGAADPGAAPPRVEPRRPAPSRTSGELHRPPADPAAAPSRAGAPPLPAPPLPAPSVGEALPGTLPSDALPPGTPGLTRDYFRVEDSAGRRFWVFREGLYGSETARPRWFVQGLFA